MTTNPKLDSVTLTEDQVDIIHHALNQTYLFDGWDQCVRNVGRMEAERIGATFVALGYPHPATEYEDDE